MMKILVSITLFAIVLFTLDPAYAEGGCPPGQYPRQGQGWQTCVPIPGANTNAAQPAPNPGHWETRWGALASYEPSGILGAANDLRTKEQAERAAMADCKAKGGVNCKLEASYQNACAALAGSDSGYVVTSNVDSPSAESEALSTCSSSGYANCHIFYSACSKAVLIK